MQPRKDLFPRLDIVFHVTKRGYSSSRLPPKTYGRRGAEETGEAEEMDAEAEEMDEEDEGLLAVVVEDELDESVKALREDAVERVDGVDEDEDDDPDPDPEPDRSPRRRDMPGRRRSEAEGRRDFRAAADFCSRSIFSRPNSSAASSDS